MTETEGAVVVVIVHREDTSAFVGRATVAVGTEVIDGVAREMKRECRGEGP